MVLFLFCNHHNQFGLKMEDNKRNEPIERERVRERRRENDREKGREGGGEKMKALQAHLVTLKVSFFEPKSKVHL